MTQGAVKDRGRDRWIPWAFVLFFAVIALIDGIFVTIAIRTQTGVVSTRAYEEGLAYNKVLDMARAQEALGWESDIYLRDGEISFALKDEKGNAIKRAAVRAVFTRPVREGHDFNLPLAEAEPGVYRANVSFPLKGQWQARIFATWQNKPYQSVKTLFVK